MAKKSDRQIDINLTGQFEVTVHEDGRLILPAEFRRQLAKAGVENLYVGKIPRTRAIVLCPPQLWDQWVSQLVIQYPVLRNHAAARKYTTPHRTIGWDSQGRMSLPIDTWSQSGTRHWPRIVIFGKGTHLELWPEEEFSNLVDELESLLAGSDQEQGADTGPD